MNQHNPVTTLVTDNNLNQRNGDDSAGDSSTDEANHPQNAGSKRKRPLEVEDKGVSCEMCKQRKVKCDRARPSCKICKDHDWTVSFITP